MGMKFANNAAATLSQAVNPADVTINFNLMAGATAFPALGAGDYFWATMENLQSNTREVVKVTAAAGQALTVTRAQDGTTAGTFSIGDKLELRLVAAALNDIPKLDEANVFTKLVTMSLGALISGGLSVAGGLALTDSQLTFPDDTTLKSNLNLGYRNKVRNPKMEIGQRGTNFPATANAYTLDGWLSASAVTTAVYTISQAANALATSDCQFVLKVLVTTADAAVGATKINAIGQPIEGYLVRDCLGQPVAIRFEVSSPKAGAHYVTLQNSGQDRSYVLPYNITAANTPQVVTVTLPTGLITAGTWNYTNGIGVRLWFPLMVGANFQTANTGSWQVGNFYSGNAQQNLLDTNGNVFTVTGVQMERAPSSSPLEHLDYGLEFKRNRRYLQVLGNGCAGGWASAVLVQIGIVFPVTMRAVPSLIQGPTTPTFSDPGIANRTGVASVYSLAAAATVNGATVNVNGFAGATASHPALSVDDYFIFSAEL